MVEGIETMLVEYVTCAKESHHMEDGELVLMDQCRSRGEPHRKRTGGAGILGWRRWSLCRGSLLWTESTFISLEESRCEARPMKSLWIE